MASKIELITGVSKQIRFNPKDLNALRWYIRQNDIKNNGKKLISVHQAVYCMVSEFVEQIVIPMMNGTAFTGTVGVRV